jgi:predicted aspartyl protease
MPVHVISKPRLYSRISVTVNADVEHTEGDTLLQAEIRSMKVKDLKEALSKLNLSTADVFEKEELVQRLLEARRNGKQRSPPEASPAQTNASNSVIAAPLYFTNMDSNIRVAAINMNGGGIQVNPSDQPYPTVEFEVDTQSSKTSSSKFKLRLLLDTACSGFVLRPSVVERNNLPMMSTPVTMTGAGGTVGATGLTQLSKIWIGGESFGPLPAEVQDIGALPSALDGIVGLSFLNNFAAVDMDFSNGKLFLHKRGAPVPAVSSEQGTLVARGRMDMIPQYGIYTVETMLGSRGPVKMLVDSGAASTFLSWGGVSSLGLSRSDNSFVQRLSSPMGAMGSDNIAMQLTHSIGVSSTINLGEPRNTNLRGLSLAGTKRLRIDIGDIAILESMKSQKVGGILGIDALMRASCVRLVLEEANREILLYQCS